MSPARDGILPVGRAPLRASEEWSWHPGRVPDVAQRDDWTDLAPIPTRAVAATADADRHASDALGIFLRPSRTPGRRAEIDRFPRSALNRAAVVEVTGRYLNPSDQGERLHDLLQIVPSRPKTVNSRTPKAIHRRLRPEQVEELVIGYKRGQPSTSWPSSSGSTGRQCPGSWREKAYLAADVPYPPHRSSKQPGCTPRGCHWSALASSLGATVAPSTLPSGRLLYGCETSTEGAAIQRRSVLNRPWQKSLLCVGFLHARPVVKSGWKRSRPGVVRTVDPR